MFFENRLVFDDESCDLSPCWQIHAADRLDAIRIAFEIGNLHFPLAVAD